MRALAAAAVILAGLAFAAPAAAGTRGPLPLPAALEVPDLGFAPRDAVLDQALPRALRAASASVQRYSVNDRKGRTVAISVSPLCTLSCTSADPQQIANFLGTLAHGDEMSLLTVRLVTPGEIAAQCGPGAGACYFPGGDMMLINGNDTTGPDGATREFVIAHEYGHHVAQHRLNPPFLPTLDWGPKRWATYERICQGVRSGVYFPGDEGSHYYQNPGEAYAESSAFNRFRNAPVKWQWARSLKPDAGAFAAIKQDVQNPWKHRTRFVLDGRLPAHGSDSVIERLRTPLDGALSLGLHGPPHADFNLLLRDRRGKPLASSRGLGSREFINFTICGQSRLRAIVKRDEPGTGRFRLVVRRP